MKKILLLLSLFTLSFSFAFAQAPNWLWAKNIAGGTSISPSSGNPLATDANGNSYVTGTFTGGSATFGTFTLTSSGDNMFIVKYDPNGNVLWAKSSGGPGGVNSNMGSGVAVDSVGNVYVTGCFGSSTITFGTFTLTNNSSIENIYLVKYNGNGNVIWAKSAGGSGNDQGIGITTDSKGNVIITGSFQSPSITFGSFVLNNTASPNNTFVAKYDPSGKVLWAESPNGGGGNANCGYDIATDAKDNIYLTGYDESSTLTFGSHTLNLIGNTDIFVVKYDSSGNVKWAKNYGGPGGAAGGNAGHGIIADTAGNAYITGYFNSSTATFGSNVLTYSGGGYAYFIAKCDTGGNVLWAQSESSTSSSDMGYGIAIDANANIYTIGFFTSDSIKFGSY
jgi:hypothetical protein